MRTKKPTLAQKKLMKVNGLDWNTWNVVKEDDSSMTLISKKSGRRRVLHKQTNSKYIEFRKKEEGIHEHTESHQSGQTGKAAAAAEAAENAEA